MRLRLLVALFLVSPWHVVCQQATPPPPAPPLPKDPRALLEAARPFYNFSDPSLKPWHLKATYQLYDDKGKPSEQGTYEYWWASPHVYRSSWKRGNASFTDWHTADDKHSYLESGGGFGLFEHKLETALLDPLPKIADLDPAKYRLDREEVKLGDTKFPCVMIVPIMPQHGQVQIVPLGLFPTYCFNHDIPVLQIRDSFGTVAEYLNRIAKVQGRYLPQDIKFFEGKQTVLSASVDQIEGISAADPSFTPAPTAIKPNSEKVQIAEAVMVGMLIKKQAPFYPQDAKDARVSGTVILQATIGRDGKIHDLRVLQTPWPSLAAASLISVSKWEYKPYMLNNEPVEVETTIKVIYALN